MEPNNVTRLLDQRGIRYSAFQLPDGKLGAVEAARFLGVPPRQVYKTIVVKRPGRGKPVLAMVSGVDEVDLKALAKYLDEKKVTLPTQREAEQMTGLRAGGISPLALLNRGFEVVLDASVRDQDQIYISGGRRGLNIRITPKAILELTGASIGQIGSRIT
jgi:Cys-tRNA(Pro)/Cys-tRNA(Cys) deacylase